MSSANSGRKAHHKASLSPLSPAKTKKQIIKPLKRKLSTRAKPKKVSSVQASLHAAPSVSPALSNCQNATSQYRIALNLRRVMFSQRRGMFGVTPTEQAADSYYRPHARQPLTSEETAKRFAAASVPAAANLADKMTEQFQKLQDMQASLISESGQMLNPLADPKSPHFIPGPNIDDTSNPYALATKHDNEEYARQVTILNKFQSQLGELKGFLDPFLGKTKQKEHLPSTVGEMNAMIQHAVLQQNDYELAWVRFSKMINATPDYLKTFLDQSLFDQFNTPTLFRRDGDVGANEQKVLFNPDLRSFQLVIISCLQAFEQIKKKYHPGMVEAALRLSRDGNGTNSLNDDELDSQATILFRQLEDIDREIKRRKQLPLEEQERLLGLENGGLGHIGQNDETALVANKVGLHKALADLRSTDLAATNKLAYSEAGITEYQLEVQKREKLLALGKSIIDFADSTAVPTPDQLKYKATRKISADDSDEDDGVEVGGSGDQNDQNGPIEIKHQYGRPILTARKLRSGRFLYRVSLPQLPFGIQEGDEMQHWMERTQGVAQISLENSQQLQEIKEQMMADPFSEPYHCLKQVSAWNARLNFVLRDIMEHYYGLIYQQNPRLYSYLRSSDKPPGPNYSGVSGFSPAIGFNTQLLSTVIEAAKDQNLFHIWLEATTLMQKLTPAPLHVPTLQQRRMMAREDYLKQMIFADLLQAFPTSNDPIDKIAATTTASTAPNQAPVPKLSVSQFNRCMSLFSDYGRQVKSYINAVKGFDRKFFGDIEMKKLQEEALATRVPKKLITQMSPDEIRTMSDERNKRDAEMKVNTLVREAHGGGEIDFLRTLKDLNNISQADFDALTPEQQQDYKARRPQPLGDMVGMDRLVGETLRRYPMLAAFVPQETSHYKPMKQIIDERYGGIENLPTQLRTPGLKLTEEGGFPANPFTIDVTKFGFDSVAKVLAFPYPEAIKKQIDDMNVSMVRVPVLNAVLKAPDDIQVNNERANYQHLMLSPATSLTTLEDAVAFVNKFTQMGKHVQLLETELGELEEINEYAYQIDHQTFLQKKYKQMVQIHQIQNNSVQVRNMSRLGMYYIDSMIISWAAQNSLKLPKRYSEIVKESYSTLTNDIFHQDLNTETSATSSSVEAEQNAAAKAKTDGDDINPLKPVEKPKPKGSHEAQALMADLAVTNPLHSRSAMWKSRNQSDGLTNGSKFFELSIDERVAMIDDSNEKEKQTNPFSLFFNSDTNSTTDNPENRYHLLRSYIRFAIRAGDEQSLQKALIMYRSSTRLLEYVQRRTNEDIYVQGGDSMFEAAKTEEEFNNLVEKEEQKKLRQQQIDEQVPAAMRADMTKDDIRRATGGMGAHTKMWNDWYGADAPESLTANDPLHKKIANDPRNQNADTGKEGNIDNLVQETGMLDDYASRINALLTAKHTGTKVKQSGQGEGTDDKKDSHSDILDQIGIDDEKNIQLYKNMVTKAKSQRLGDLFVPGYDDSDGEESSEDDQDGLDLARAHLDKDVELDGPSGSSSTKPKKPVYSSQMTQDGRMQIDKTGGDGGDDGDDEKDGPETTNHKHAPHTRLAKLAKASHVKFDYPLTQMVINLHQFLIRNGSTMYRVGLPVDVQSKRFSDEVTAHWALARRTLYDNRIALIHSFDEKINPETGQEYTTSEMRERQKDKAKAAVAMMKKNRAQETLRDFEREAGQIAIMTLDTLILENFIPVAKITAKQAYDDGLLSKDFIESIFQNQAPDLESTPQAIMAKEMGLDKMAEHLGQ